MSVESHRENLSEPVLVARFEDITRKPDIEPKAENFSNIFEDEEYRKQCFDEAHKAFLSVYNKEKFDEYLNAEPSNEGRDYLKKVRKFGLILRAMYNFFDEAHQCPENFQQFLFTLGKYNDRYLLKKSKRIKPQDVLGFDNLDVPVDFVDDKDFKKYVEETLSQIDELMEKSILPAESFHDLRKKVRLFASLMQVTASENYGGNLQWLFASILELSVMLGEKHDELVSKDLVGDIDYHSSKVVVDGEFASKFLNLEPFIKKVVGLP